MNIEETNWFGKAAQAWCHESTKHLDMIPELAMVFALILKEQHDLLTATLAEKEAEEYLLREQLEEWKKRAMSYKSLAAARQEEIERLNADLVIQLERSQRMVSRVDYDADVSRLVAGKDAEIERLKKAVERAVEVLSLRTCYKDCPNNPKCAVLTMVSKGDCGDYWREWLMGEGK